MEINTNEVKQENIAHAASFTGHRLIAREDLPLIEQRLDETIADLINQGIVYWGSGGALGFDQRAAHAVLRAREKNPEVKLIMVLPCINQDERWKESEKAAYSELLDRADKVLYVSKEPYFDGCMAKRNLYLIEHSSVCVAYMRRGRSGTSQTVRLGGERGLKIINLVGK